MPCYKCRSKSLTRDDVTGALACDSCGIVQEFDSYDSFTGGGGGGVSAPEGVLIRVGGSGTGSVLNYRDKKLFESNRLIEDYCFKLDISSKVSDVKNMISKITDGEFGLGDWFPVLIGACAYVIMRSESRSMSMSEIGVVIGCDVYELGRMIGRVVDYLGLKLPEFDVVLLYEKVVRKLSSSRGFERGVEDRLRKQGVFLIQCAVKWFLTTGRRPGPIVVAVLVLVAELNGVAGVKFEDLASEVCVTVSTCRRRYRELLQALVKVAQVLPWGNDVTVKNVVKNGQFVIRYMEMKSMGKSRVDQEGVDVAGFDLGEVINECLRKDGNYENGYDEIIREPRFDASYFEFGNRVASDRDSLQLSHECLSMAYNKFLEDSGSRKSRRVQGKTDQRKRKRGCELHATEWWNGKSELSKRLLLKQILEKDVGLDASPPSFVNGLIKNERRRTKIHAAKLRIGKIMNPWTAETDDNEELCTLEDAQKKKRKRRKNGVLDLDWEDFVIETLLLHQVEEDEIEKGHYDTLLDLHVFNSGIHLE